MYFASAQEMEKLDDLAVANNLAIRQMMELAGWHMMSVFSLLKIKTTDKVVVVCGRGNKGGDGLSAARHLANSGYDVSVVLISRDLKEDPKHHLAMLVKMGVTISDFSQNGQDIIQSVDIIIDALLGYHLDGNPRGVYGEAIEIINSSKAKVIAYDLPSGTDASTGKCLAPCIKADLTLSLALAKKVFDTDDGRAQSGQVYLADIGIPSFLYDKIKTGSRPDFGERGIIKIV